MTDGVTRDGAARRAVPNWLWAGLIVSVALNLLVAGTMASAWWTVSEEAWPTRGGLSRNVVSFVRSLPAERREVLRGPIDKVRQQIGPLRRAVYRQRQAVVRLVGAEPFDRARFEVETAKLVKAEMELRQAAHGPIAEVLALLTADERRQLASWNRNRRGNGWKRGPATPSPAGKTSAEPGAGSEAAGGEKR